MNLENELELLDLQIANLEERRIQIRSLINTQSEQDYLEEVPVSNGVKETSNIICFPSPSVVDGGEDEMPW